jgi:hypothetical protein
MTVCRDVESSPHCGVNEAEVDENVHDWGEDGQIM